MKVEFVLGIGISGARQVEIMEFPDDYTEDDIYTELDEWKCQYIDAGFQVLEDNNDVD